MQGVHPSAAVSPWIPALADPSRSVTGRVQLGEPRHRALHQALLEPREDILFCTRNSMMKYSILARILHLVQHAFRAPKNLP